VATRRWVDELALGERAEVLAWLWDAQSEGVMLLDATGRVLDANDAAAALLGLPRDALIGATREHRLWRCLHHPDGSPVALDELPGAPRGPRPDAPPALFAVRCPGRSEVLVRARASRHRGDAAGPFTLVTLVDVTTELHAHRTVERGTASVEEFVFTAALEDAGLRLTYAGPGIERLLGGPVPAGTSPEAAWFAAVHPEDVEIARSAMRDTAAGRPTTAAYRLIGLDGRVRWVRARTQRRVEADATYIDGIVSDITTALLHEDELLGFRALVEASSSFIALLDPGWRVRWMNAAALAMTGLDAASAPGTPYVDLVDDLARAAHLAVERPAVEAEGRWVGESILRPAHDAARPTHVEAMSDLIRHQTTGRPLGVVAIRRDIGNTRRLTREHEAIGHVATTIASGADRTTIFAAASREAARVLDGGGGGIAAFTGPSPQIVGSWHAGRRGDTLLERAVERLAAPLRAGHGPCAVALDGDDHCLGTPVRVEGAVWGMIVVCRKGEPFSTEDERALERLGGLVGTAVGVADARDVLVRQATTDGLTGLSNHRAFHDTLQAEVRRARRYRRPIAVVLVDLDNFKQVNDRAGHQAGDRLLQSIAGALHDVVRGTETVARLGGDEFALLLPETDLDGAYLTADRVRTAIEVLPEAVEHGVTASAGVADLAQASSADDLLRFADGALYWSKVHGRNCVSAYDPERVEALSAQERAERLARTHALGAVQVIARLIDLKDTSTHEHSERVAELAVRLAAQLGWPEERRNRLRDAALVHDVGKVVIADRLLNKAGPLTEEEFALLKEHPATGARIAAEALDAEQVRWISEHHERPDGTGYPAGLGAGEISPGGRILAFADGWDVMTSPRPYKAAKPPAQAREECHALAGAQFDEEVLEAFECLWRAGAVDPLV
jgi:diguanylate cyclase (GGDEF)-like protein